jgi:outer membrane beta-barrel protein
MKSKRFLSVGFCLVLCGLVLAPLGSASAQSAGYGEGGKVYAVQKKGYQLKHELHGAVGVLPMDAFYKGVTFGGGYTYHFSHHFAWEAIQFLYSSNIDTGLKDKLRSLPEPYSSEPLVFREVKMLANSNIVFVPLYGKMSWLNRKVVQTELYLTAGPGIAAYRQFERVGAEGYAEETKYFFSANFGMGVRVFLNNHFSCRLDLRDYMNFIDGTVDNAAYFGLGLSWNFRMPRFSSGDE